MTGMPPGQVIVSLIGIIAIIVAAYYVTYFIGAKSQKMYRNRGIGRGRGRGRGKGKGRSIVILERFSVSKDKSFCIVEIAGKVYIVGITNQSMTVLDTLEAEVYEELLADSDDNSNVQGTQASNLSGIQGAIVSFLSKKIAKKRGEAKPAGNISFQNSINNAINNSSEQPDLHNQADLTGGSEGEE